MEPFIGQIQIFGFNYAPRDWALCNGATLAIRQNTALFSLLGTMYGGDGKTTFMLPNFAGRTGCNQGQAAGLTPRNIGDTFGENSVMLTADQMPAHSHPFTIYDQSDAAKRTGVPANGSSLVVPQNSTPFSTIGTANTQFSSRMGGVAGGSQPHENRQPYLAMNFCIALSGVFPAFGDPVA
ncbi:phage tail protein [Nitrobacter winogradskyi]|uniref:Microcystin-dependent protein n=2 Tax=Nitrobacter winogradskyi TaxID=913 RepID=A0ACC6AHT2_NITWI|nr:tail fiber protein [Nitrobacter winogradskyi]MCP1999412.1 microcystin-dependent protein [Nitrobacter winogradskyi]GEC14406.1 microcystin dependent protein [Nitrobacter winogradskyi]